MENILQSIVKIIIIGSLYTSTNVDGNRQFLPPPLPYYQPSNPDFFLPGFVPPYYDPVPVYYPEPHAPPPISYQNVNSYTPPQLFHQNENYNPGQLANPGNPSLRHPTPHIFHHKPNAYQPFGQKNNFGHAKVNYKKPLVQVGAHTVTSQKKPAFYATNIVVKEESPQPYYHDEYNNNYQEEDYTENYSDEAPSSQEPCLLNSPYRYFESSKTNPNDPNPNKLTLCNPYFQPNFGNNVYTVKMPITLLPSRFPPRVEQLIERIQNYFSTYTQQGNQNETSTAATVQPVVTEIQSQTEATTTPTVVTGDNKKKNTTTEIEELTLLETNPEPNETAVVGTPATVTNEKVTQKTIVVEVEATEEETFSTAVPEVHVEAHIAKAAPQTTQLSENVVSATATPANHGEVLQASEQNFPTAEVHKAEDGASSENQISNEWSPYNRTGYMPMTETQPVDMKAPESTAFDISNKTEENLIQPTKETLPEVTDTNG